jgi:hypothetical protein
LSPGFLLQLSFDAAAFACQLPWYSLARELMNRAKDQWAEVTAKVRGFVRRLGALPRLALRRFQPCAG